MRIDTGQQMDIVYTTQRLLVVIPTGSQTSMIISKNEPELLCYIDNSSSGFIAQLITLFNLYIYINIYIY